jgi:hypothetical protein
MNSQKYKPAIANIVTTATTGMRHLRLEADVAGFFAPFAANACPQLAQNAALLGLADPHDAHFFPIIVRPTHIMGISAGKPAEKGWKIQASSWRSNARTSLSMSLSCCRSPSTNRTA